MSNAVSTLVYSRLVGSMARKAVLGYFADRASDDGSGIWTSKQRIADEIECSKQTVITVIRGLIADGLVAEVGERRCGNGYTVEYRMVLEGIAALPLARPDDAPVQKRTGPKLDRSNGLTPRGQTALPKPPLNHQTPEDACASSSPQGAKKPAAAPRADRSKGKGRAWSLPPIAELPPHVAAIARQWPPGAYETHGEGHAAWLAANPRRRGNADEAWHARIIDLGDRPLRQAKGGLRFDGPTPGGDLFAVTDRGADLERSAAVFDRMGRAEDAADMRRRAAALASGG